MESGGNPTRWHLTLCRLFGAKGVNKWVVCGEVKIPKGQDLNQTELMFRVAGRVRGSPALPTPIDLRRSCAMCRHQFPHGRCLSETEAMRGVLLMLMTITAP